MTRTVTPTLLGRLKERNSEAWRELTALYGPIVYRWCRGAGLSPEDAADVGQEVFQSVAANIAGFRRDREGDTFGGWLRTIARNKVRDHWRHRASANGEGGSSAHQRLEQCPDPIELDAATSVDGGGSLFRPALEAIRAEFTPRTWTAFWEVVVEGRPAAEVASELGISPGAVYIAKSRVIRRFRDKFSDLIP